MKYDCRVCGEKREAEKWVEITSLPQHMMVVLNRFSWDPEKKAAIKEPTPVEIERYVTVGGVQYDLYAAIIHVGTTTHSGHYYTIGRPSESEDKWYKYDDSKLLKLEDGYTSIANLSNTATSASPYVIFFRRSDATPAPTIYMESDVKRKADI
eukprot:GHVU01034598.1.p1 GENE.GHVU01034598.1~~GHVU01034598.1.p1  ORF type:complete len:153 (-),score=20.18 GHVU01034598.1:131-589(-)